MKCPLCQKNNHLSQLVQGRNFYFCDCGLSYLDQSEYLKPDEEKKRYSFHQNNPDEEKYGQYLASIIQVIKPFITQEMHGLDYGTGPSVSLAKVLTNQGFHCDYYDKYFYPEMISQQYDYIILCEVIEHIQDLNSELVRFKSLLKSGGKIFIKTEIFDSQINFENWYYKNDPTHVIFFNQKSLQKLASLLQLNYTQLTKNIFLFAT